VKITPVLGRGPIEEPDQELAIPELLKVKERLVGARGIAAADPLGHVNGIDRL
jgi:hypothetical protein